MRPFVSGCIEEIDGRRIERLLVGCDWVLDFGGSFKDDLGIHLGMYLGMYLRVIWGCVLGLILDLVFGGFWSRLLGIIWESICGSI